VDDFGPLLLIHHVARFYGPIGSILSVYMNAMLEARLVETERRRISLDSRD
jgi:hypothetical protein